MPKLTRREFINRCASSLIAFLGSPYLALWNNMKSADASHGGASLEPPYLRLHKTGELKKRGERLWGMMERCQLCPRRCGYNRLGGTRGFCGASSQLEIASFYPHFGEEEGLVGIGGSGTIFLSNCSLRCVFCINWQVSRGIDATACSIDDFAGMMLKLQSIGCGNINLVTPTHYVAHILLALDKAAASGLRIPIVYNTCGWERLEILKELDGVVDIYLPDFKYASSEMAARYSAGAFEYPEMTKQALLEMYRQVGIARPYEDGLIYRGLMIRHLVMPNNVGGTKDVIGWIAQNLPKDTYLNLMSQYQPHFQASGYPEINRRITIAEYEQAKQWAAECGLTNVHLQGL